MIDLIKSKTGISFKPPRFYIYAKNATAMAVANRSENFDVKKEEGVC